VVPRLALKINPETAEVFIDATGSDPIPHIVVGVVLDEQPFLWVAVVGHLTSVGKCARAGTGPSLVSF